jgi:hypothetical protein
MLDEARALLNTVPRSFLAHVSPESHVVFQQHLESALASGKMETCELSLRVRCFSITNGPYPSPMLAPQGSNKYLSET